MRRLMLKLIRKGALIALLQGACSPESDGIFNDEILEQGPVDEDDKTIATLAKSGLYSYVDLQAMNLTLTNPQTDQRIVMALHGLPGWPGLSAPLHTLALADMKTIYVSLIGTATDPSGIVVLDISRVNWSAGTAQVRVKKVIITDPAGSHSSYPAVTQISPRQPIAAWTQPGYPQVHGPTRMPGSPFAYFTMWTDKRIHVIDTSTHKLAAGSPIVFDNVTNQTHGVYFNPSGTLGIGTGYYYDRGEIDVYRTDKSTGQLSHWRPIKLGSPSAYAAFTHHNIWLNDRYALTGTMQLGPTSLTPAGADILPPSVWLLDVPAGKATQIIGPAASDSDAGVYRSASDLAVVGSKLYVAEEDSIGSVFGRDGFLAVWDITDINHPKFSKRLRPGVELPAAFFVAHALAPSTDGKQLFLESYPSGFVLKIDTATDSVVSVRSSADGLVMPHGGFIAGNTR